MIGLVSGAVSFFGKINNLASKPLVTDKTILRRKNMLLLRFRDTIWSPKHTLKVYINYIEHIRSIVTIIAKTCIGAK